MEIYLIIIISVLVGYVIRVFQKAGKEEEIKYKAWRNGFEVGYKYPKQYTKEEKGN